MTAAPDEDLDLRTAEALLRRTAAVVVSFNTVNSLRQCLATLRGAGAGRAMAVIVVDNASEDGSVEMVREDFPDVVLVESPENLGFGRAVNLGAERADRDFLVTLNPDVLAPPLSLARLSRRLDADPGLGFAGPRILKANGTVDHASLRGDPDPAGAALYFTRVARLFPRSPRLNRYNLAHLDYNTEHDLLSGTGGCLAFRTEAFRQVGGFDPNFFMYGEDLDLCRRVRAAGWRGVYLPSASVVHAKGEATRQHSGEMLVEFHRAMWTYYVKHEAGQHPRPFNWLVAAGIGGLAGARLAANAIRREKRVSAR